MERHRTYTWENPITTAQAAQTMSGIDFLQAISRGELPPPPIFGTMGMTEMSAEKGKVTFYFTPAEYHYNPIGSVHGGVISTVLDSAMACSVHSLLPVGVLYTTLELKINFLRAVSMKSGRLICSGKVIHHGSRSALVEGQLVDADGKIYAHGVSTCLILTT